MDEKITTNFLQTRLFAKLKKIIIALRMLLGTMPSSGPRRRHGHLPQVGANSTYGLELMGLLLLVGRGGLHHRRTCRRRGHQLAGGKQDIGARDDGGDNFNYDHGDWINPTLVLRDGREVPLTGIMATNPTRLTERCLIVPNRTVVHFLQNLSISLSRKSAN